MRTIETLFFIMIMPLMFGYFMNLLIDVKSRVLLDYLLITWIRGLMTLIVISVSLGLISLI